MGWWEGSNPEDVIGDGPADTFTEALERFAAKLGRLPDLREILDALHAALARNPGVILSDPYSGSTRLHARLNDDAAEVESSEHPAPDGRLLSIMYQALEDIAVDYQDMEDHRKPRLNEVLETLAFVLGPDDQAFVRTPLGKGVASIHTGRSS